MTGWIVDDDRTIALQACQDIPIGSKVALREMAPGDTGIKQGIDIGNVVAPIGKGEHAHVDDANTKRW
jgi:(2R)-sulfolactate sulfo-lyase subunit alpha